MNTLLLLLGAGVLIWKLSGSKTAPAAADPHAAALAAAQAAANAAIAALQPVPAAYSSAGTGAQFSQNGVVYVIWEGKAVPFDSWEHFNQLLRTAAGG